MMLHLIKSINIIILIVNNNLFVSETLILNKLDYRLIIDYIITNLILGCALQNAFQDRW